MKKTKTKTELIKDILLARLETSIVVEEMEEDLKYYRELPNDILGKEIEDVFGMKYIIENPNYKNDGLESYSHQIGYMTAKKYELDLVLELLDMSVEEIEDSIKRDEEISKQNKKMLDDLFDEIKKK